MKKVKNWFLLFSFAFAGSLFGTKTAEKSLIMVVNDTDTLNTPKDSYTISASNLAEGEKLFDLICVGKCDLKSGEKSIGICGDKDNFPMLIEVGKDENVDSAINGQIIFKKLSSIWTITMPAGHQAYVTVGIEGIKGKYTEMAEYAALKIQKNGETDASKNKILCLPPENVTADSSVNMLMESEDVVELIPVFNKSAISGESYDLAEAGGLVNQCNFITDNTDTFDFGTVFRVSVNCSKTEPSGGLWSYK